MAMTQVLVGRRWAPRALDGQHPRQPPGSAMNRVRFQVLHGAVQHDAGSVTVLSPALGSAVDLDYTTLILRRQRFPTVPSMAPLPSLRVNTHFNHDYSRLMMISLKPRVFRSH
jgi:hypothetical protein